MLELLLKAIIIKYSTSETSENKSNICLIKIFIIFKDQKNIL